MTTKTRTLDKADSKGTALFFVEFILTDLFHICIEPF